MADLQKQFEKFHKKIKVEMRELQEKRNIIFNKIRDSLNKNEKPIPELLNQGSYIYGVGIKPISAKDSYDIDVGLVFNVRSKDYKAEEIRKWVYEAVRKHTKYVEEKGHCIRVNYEAGYHVDLICYSKYRNDNRKEDFQLAHKDGSWRNTDPKNLKNYINKKREYFRNTVDSSGSDQLQRVVRYLKRWNDKALTEKCRDKPVGLAILLYCIEKLPSPKINSGKSEDIEALIKITFSAKSSDRIFVHKPTPEQEDLFGKISSAGMKKLIKRFSDLYNALVKAKNEDKTSEACKILIEFFGEDFPSEKDKENSFNNPPVYIRPERPYRTS